MPRVLILFPLFALLAACTQPVPQVAGPNTPGWTGQTVVPGGTSTVAGDAEATYQQQKWGVGQRH